MILHQPHPLGSVCDAVLVVSAVINLCDSSIHLILHIRLILITGIYFGDILGLRLVSTLDKYSV